MRRKISADIKSDPDLKESEPWRLLWAEVLHQAIIDYKRYIAYRRDPESHPLDKKTLRSILFDGCDPEYWLFQDNTGFEAVCLVLDYKPSYLRKKLREWEASMGFA